MRISIIGLGNSLLGDDAAGIYVCERLAERISGLDTAIDIKIYSLQGLFPEYTEEVSQADTAIFIDAAVGVEGHGTFQCRRIFHEEITDEAALCGHSTPFHGLSLLHFLKLCKDVYGRLPSDIRLYTISAYEFTPFDGLSKGVMNACDGLIHELFIELGV